MTNYHLAHHKADSEWKLTKAHADRAALVFGNQSKEEAVNQSAKWMRETFTSPTNSGSLKIHRLDGTIEEERTYPSSADPRKTPG